MRYDAPEPFAGCYIEYSDAWSVREFNGWLQAAWPAPLETVRRKCSGVRLVDADGQEISAAAELTDERLEDLDLRLFSWLTGTFAAVARDLGKLGEASRRSLFDSSAGTNQTTGGE